MKQRIINGVQERWCGRHNNKVGAWLPDQSFGQGKTNGYCKECRASYFKETYDPTRKRNANFKYYYKQDGHMYDQLLASQGGVCALCKKPPEPRPAGRYRTESNYLSLDHDHKTGKVRGLLCQRCNFIMGWVDEDPSIWEAVKTYLQENDIFL